jgi:hypothetical protein
VFWHLPMSMRIHNNEIGATGASASAPVETALQRQGSLRPSGSAGFGGADYVEISSLSGNIAATSAALVNQQAARVSRLAALYAGGDYQVDSMQLSRALISGSLAGGGFESEGSGGSH